MNDDLAVFIAAQEQALVKDRSDLATHEKAKAAYLTELEACELNITVAESKGFNPSDRELGRWLARKNELVTAYNITNNVLIPDAQGRARVHESNVNQFKRQLNRILALRGEQA